jgi:hypothetical protein
MSKGFVIEFEFPSDDARGIGGTGASEEEGRFRVLIQSGRIRAFEEFRNPFGEPIWILAQDGGSTTLDENSIIALAFGGFIAAETRVWRDLPSGLRLIDIGTIQGEEASTMSPPTTSFIGPATDSVGMFCAELDVAMARCGGWTEDDIATTWQAISTAVRTTNQRAAFRIGHTRQCPDCECWTVPDGPCHLCTAR